MIYISALKIAYSKKTKHPAAKKIFRGGEPIYYPLSPKN